MTKAKRTAMLSAIVSFLLCVIIAFGCMYASEEATTAQKSEGSTVTLTADEQAAEKVNIAVDGNSQYMIIFSTEGTSDVQVLANAIRKGVMTCGANLQMKPQSQKKGEYEILIGNTNRDVSQEMLAVVKAQATAEKPYVWAYGYKDGKLFYVANNDTAFAYGSQDFIDLIDEDGKLIVSSDLMVIEARTQAEYDKYLADKAEAERQAQIEELKKKNDKFKDEEKLTSGYQSMIGEDGFYKVSPYEAPWAYPTSNQHPRYLITAKDVETIRAMMDDPQYEAVFNNLKRLAESDIKEGVFPERNLNSEVGPNRYSESIISGVQARAMMYLLTGDEVYAYEAIIAVKNMILTLKYTTDLHMDVYHGASHVMVALAAVYDWCYDVMTEEDKWQIITGTVTCLWPTMEFAYPPYNYNGISGHGTGPQFLRDYMSLAVAFYDEAPDWWEFVMGRYFEEYLPVTNAQYENGWISQGTACYAPIKLMVQLWAANLIYVCTGENFLTDDAAICVQMFISQIQPNGKYFQTGDGGRTVDGTNPGFAEYLVSAALYNDPIACSWAKYLSNNFSKYNQDSIFTMTPDFELCFLSRITAEDVDKYESVGLIQYILDPAGQMTARNSWDSDAAAVFMKVGNMTNANHDIYDHGTFQIYYKGLLAATSGSYKQYGGDSHYYYLQYTVSQNGLLIFNPSFAADAVMSGDKVTNPASYYYSGGQHRLGAPSTLTEWQNGSYRMAETTGAAWDYNRDGSVKFAYLAGDITDSYDDRTVDYVGRRMLTIYTGNDEIPMVFLTFDEITSDSETFEKTYLLHTINEPTIDADNMTAEIISGDGRMIFNSLYGAQVIEKIGGEGKAYWINGYYKEDGTYVEGKNCLDEYTPDDNYMNIWGRLQLRASGEKTTNFLSAMYVSDATSEATLEIKKFQNDSVYGAAFGDSIAVFAIGREKTYKSFSFETEGTGLYNYYISGICDGTWNVKVDGVSVAYTLSSDESGILTFTAPTGSVELIPGSDVIGANGGKIQYNAGGAVLPDDTNYSYNNEVDTPLPTTATRGEDVFLGWYLSSEYLPEEKVTFVPAGATGTFRVYAKWLTTFVNEDYTSSKVNNQKSSATINGITYYGESKPDSSFKTKTDEDGRNYLEWLKGPNDSFIYRIDTNENISTCVSEDKSVSITVEIASEDGAPYLPSAFQIVAKQNVSGVQISSQHTTIFKTDLSGKVTLGQSKVLGSFKDTDRIVLRIAIDFKNGLIKAYDEENNVIASMAYNPPSALGAKTPEEAMACYSQYVFYWHGDSTPDDPDSAMRIYKIKVQDGNIFEGVGDDVTTGGIKYNTYGGTLPTDAPKSYSSEAPTLLPTNVVKEGAVFRGWYTSDTFEESTRTYYVPTTATGVYEVYAKWSYYLADETFDGKSFSIIENSGGNGSLNYNGGSASEPKPGSSFVTVEDGDNTYLKASVGTKNAIIYNASNSYNLTHFTETAISFEFSLKKLEGIDFPSVRINIPTSGSKYGELNVMTITEAGEAKLMGSSEVFATVGEDAYTTFRITVNFADSTIYAYDADGNVISSVRVTSVPGGQSSLADWQKVATNYMFYFLLTRTDKTEGKVSSLAIDNVKIAEGDIFYKEEVVLPTGSGINYKTNGGKLPEGAPTEYDSVNGTLLPTDVKKTGYAFGGWYTSSDFAEETRAYYVPVGTTGSFTVYAKWLEYLTDESYGETKIDFENADGKGDQSERFGITYNYTNNGAAFKTVEGEDGSKYLRVDNKIGGYNSVIRTSDTNYNITNFNETAISFEIGFSKLADVDLSRVSWSLESSGSVGGSGRLSLVAINPDGTVNLVGSEKVIGTVTEGVFTKVRLCVDFALGTVTAYDADGNVLDSVAPAVPGGFKSFLEWQSTGLKHHILFMSIINPNEKDSETASAILIDGIKVVEGRAFSEPVTKIPANTSIDYVTGNGKLPEGALTEYDAEVGYILPTPKRDGYVFGGWYTTASFDAGTEIEYISIGTTGAVKVYAKWLSFVTNEDYSETEFEFENNGSGSQSDRGGIVYNYTNAGVGFKTVEGEDGSKYLRVDNKVGGWKNGVIRTTDNSYNISTFEETAVSFEIGFSKIPDVALSRVGWSLESSSGAGGSGRLDLLVVDPSDGSIKLAGGFAVIGTVTEGVFTKVRLCVDFELGTVTAYDADGNVLDSVAPAEVPGGFKSFLEWQRNGLMNHILFMSIVNTNAADSGIETGILIDGIKVIDGRAYRTPVTKIPANTTIDYVLSNGKLPEGAPTDYDAENGTILPIPTRDGYTFGGWYTTKSLEDGTEIKYIPAETTGAVKVYAKWLNVVTNEDYSETKIDFVNNGSGSQPDRGGIVYNYLNAGAIFQTVEDDSGNKYLYIGNTVSGYGSVVRTYDSGYNISTFEETAVSFEVGFAKIPGTDLSYVGFVLETPGSTNGNLSLATIDPTDGSIKLAGSEKVIGTVTEGAFTKVRICVDFALGAILAYDENGKVLDSVTPNAPKDFESLADWQRNGLGAHIFFMSISNPNEKDSETNIATGIYVDGIKVVDGRAFVEKLTEIPGEADIKYELDGGELPADAPTDYDAENGTTLPTPTRDGYTFGGWYTSADLSDDSLITEIAAGTTGTVTVYAKWTEIQKGIIVYVCNEGTLPADAPTEYIIGTETELPDAYCSGLDFIGWYTTEDFQEGTRVTKVPADATGEFKVYAKFEF